MNVLVHERTCAWTYLCMNIHVHEHTCAWKYECMDVSLHEPTSAWTYMCMSLHMHEQTFAWLYICICISVPRILSMVWTSFRAYSVRYGRRSAHSKYVLDGVRAYLVCFGRNSQHTYIMTNVPKTNITSWTNLVCAEHCPKRTKYVRKTVQNILTMRGIPVCTY